MKLKKLPKLTPLKPKKTFVVENNQAVPVKNTSPALNTVHNREKQLMERGRMVLNEALKSLYRGYMTDECDERDMDAEFKYPTKPYTIETYKWWYQYNGVAKRVVEALAEACWAVDPEVLENNGVKKSPFELDVAAFIAKHNMLSKFLKLDVCRGIGEYGGFLLGWNDLEEEDTLETPAAKLSTRGDKILGPRKRGMQLDYIRVFDQSQVKVTEWDTDALSVRNGMPIMYQITFGTEGEIEAVSQEETSYFVHWTRFFHSADNVHTGVALGHPRLEPVLEYVFDTKKVAGGSAEMFWRAAMPGYSFETQPEMLKDGMPEIDTDSVSEQIKLFTDGFQRFVATVGMTANSLAPQVTKPNDHVQQFLQLICITIKMPYRMFVGVEAGHLASSNEGKTMEARLSFKRNRELSPEMVVPFFEYMVAMEQVRPNKKPIFVKWPNDAMAPETAESNLKLIQGLVQYMTGQAAKVVPPEVLLVDFLGYTEERAADILAKAKAFIKANPKFLPPDPVPVSSVGGNQKGKAKKAKTGRPKGKLEKV